MSDSDLRRTPVGRRLERDDVEECEERAGRNAPRTAMALYRVCFDHVRTEVAIAKKTQYCMFFSRRLRESIPCCCEFHEIQCKTDIVTLDCDYLFVKKSDIVTILPFKFLVTKIGYCDYFTLQISAWSQKGPITL